jgi:predicted cupin superfamily sugar epimerase
MNPGEYWIQKLGLARHPEGGYFREIYRSSEGIPRKGLPDRYDGPRFFSTSMYYLLSGEEVSYFHRLKSDEIWHFYRGSFLSLYVISPEGRLGEIQIGSDIEAGQVFQTVIPAGHWFAASVGEPDSYSLVGCTVAPGFDFRDFELGQRNELLAVYPQHQAIIKKLTRI